MKNKSVFQSPAFHRGGMYATRVKANHRLGSQLLPHDLYKNRFFGRYLFSKEFTSTLKDILEGSKGELKDHEATHYRILKNKAWRIHQLIRKHDANQFDTAKLHAIERQIFREVARNNYIGSAIFAAITLLAVVATIVGILIATGVIIPDATVTLANAITLSDVACKKLCLIGGGLTTFFASTGSAGLFMYANSAKQIYTDLQYREKDYESLLSNQAL